MCEDNKNLRGKKGETHALNLDLYIYTTEFTPMTSQQHEREDKHTHLLSNLCLDGCDVFIDVGASRGYVCFVERLEVALREYVVRFTGHSSFLLF